MKCIFCTVLCYFLLVNFIHAQNTVSIQGTWKNGPKSVWLNAWEDATTAKSSTLVSTIDSIKHTFEFQFELENPTILRLANEPFIVIPGDTVFVNIVNSEYEPTLSFEGPKHLEHSFLMRLNEKLARFRNDNYLVGENPLGNYKAAATFHFDSTLLFLDNYFPKQKTNEAFQKIAKDFLTIQYYSNLIYPVGTSKSRKENTPPGYFDPVDSNFLKDANLLGFREFILLVSYFNYYIYSSASPLDHYYDSTAVGARIESANINFEGEVKDHLLLFTFTNLIENGISPSRLQVNQLYEYLIAAFAGEPARIIQIKEFKNNFDMVGKPLPEKVLAQQMKTKDGKEISLKEVLSSNDVIYVDFWASWCGPCLHEMPSEKQLISEFRGKKVKFILISLDENAKKWQNAMAKINIEGEHFIIAEGFKSVLAKYLIVHDIPRYLIFDSNGKLISRDAPRPGYILKNKSVLHNLLK